MGGGPIVLSIDGGGARGYAAARILAELRRRVTAVHGDRAVSHFGKCFDLVAGTSTGAILAAAIASMDEVGAPLIDIDDVIHLYRTETPEIFRRDIGALVRSVVRPRFIQSRLGKELQKHCRGASFGQVVTNLMVPVYDAEAGRTKFFRAGPGWRNGPEMKLSDVLLSAAAAPLYFGSPSVAPIGTSRVQRYVDAAVTLNNPALRAVSEARMLFSTHAEELTLISIGTGNPKPQPVEPGYQNWGIAQWLNPIEGIPLMQLLMEAQSAEVHDHVASILWKPGQYIRLDPHFEGAAPGIDDADAEAFERMDEAVLRTLDANDQLLEELGNRLADRLRHS